MPSDSNGFDKRVDGIVIASRVLTARADPLIAALVSAASP
jgi:hypothetical protein